MTHLKEGDQAPNFSAKDQTGQLHNLSDYADKKLLLFFYPKDNTPGCTKEACNLRDNYAALQTAGYAIVGVSPDGESSHVKFIEKYELPFPLLADTEVEVANAYGVFGEKQFMGKTFQGIHRTTFVIDESGKIERIIKKVKTDNHAAQILEG